MWSKILQVVVVQVIVPLLKDLAFMLINFVKVRQIRKEVERNAQAKADALKKAQTDLEIKDAFENLP